LLTITAKTSIVSGAMADQKTTTALNDEKSEPKGFSPPSPHDGDGVLEENVDEEEPELHARTWVAVAAMFLLNFIQVAALDGPPAVVRLLLPIHTPPQAP
jgi:hypothetical protein